MSDIVKRIGERIRELRLSRGLCQEQLAERANLNTSFIGQIERGGKKPTIETIDKIVNALDITFEELFNFEKNTVNIADSTVIEKIAFELNGRSLEEQETIYNIVKQILKFKDR